MSFVIYYTYTAYFNVGQFFKADWNDEKKLQIVDSKYCVNVCFCMRSGAHPTLSQPQKCWNILHTHFLTLHKRLAKEKVRKMCIVCRFRVPNLNDMTGYNVGKGNCPSDHHYDYHVDHICCYCSDERAHTWCTHTGQHFKRPSPTYLVQTRAFCNFPIPKVALLYVCTTL